MEKYYSKQNIADACPMSDIQLGMVYYSLEKESSKLYHNQSVYQVTNKDINIDILKNAIELLADKHEILRTNYNLSDYSRPLQIVYHELPLDIEILDLSGLDKVLQETKIKNVLNNDLQLKFEFSEVKPLWRIKLIRLNKKHICFIWICHHSITDGWSTSSLITEIYDTYDKLTDNSNYLPKKLGCTYKDYVINQELIKKDNEIKEFWKEELKNSKRLDYFEFINSEISGSNISTYYRKISKDSIKLINQFSIENSISVKNLFFTAYLLTISKLSFDKNITVGLITNNRPIHKDGIELKGCFLNTVPFHMYLNSKQSLLELSQWVNNKMNNLVHYGQLSFHEILKVTHPNLKSNNPLFDTIFNYIDFHVLNKIDSDFFENEKENVLNVSGHELTNTFLNFDINSTLEGISLAITYNEDIIANELVNELADIYLSIINEININSETRINQIDLLAELSKKKLINEFNDTKVEYDSRSNINFLFLNSVKTNPNKVAIVHEDEFLTYSELNRIANIVASKIISLGCKPNSPICILNDKSIDVIISILAIIKAGCIYVPLDTRFPHERIRYIVEDSNSDLILISKNYEQVLGEITSTLTVNSNIYKSACKNVGDISINNSNLYIMYTSGSTGKAKGSIIKQESIIRLVKNSNYINLNNNSRILQKASYSFDASTFEIWASLINEGTLILSDKHKGLNANSFEKLIQKNNINVLWLTSPLFNQLVNEDPNTFKGLKYLLVGGDVLSPFHINQVKEAYPKINIINGYGPTENTTFTSCFNIDKKYSNNIPIGKPVTNTECYILDNELEITPMGAFGELCTSGDGLALGYLNNPDLTEEKFIDHPFKDGKRLYQTGDMARWLPNGNIEFVGRIDQQVKIRGFRIELGEIESVLQKHKNIKECVVISRNEKGDKYLCAYLVKEREIEEEELREYLLPELPEYMIPSCFVTLDHIPLTRNGKIDHKSLPVPEIIRGKDYEAPSNDQELSLVEIWSEVLNIPESEISVTSDFFTLGGHSLKASILIGKIHKKMEVEFPFRDIFKYSSIRLLSNRINQIKRKGFESIPKAKDQDYYQLSSAQKRLYLLQQFNLDSTAYNMPLAISLSSEFEKEKIEAIIKELISRHESFRTRFSVIGDEPVQIIDSDIEFKLEEYTIDKSELSSLQVNFIRPFDLSHVPLLRAAIVDMHEAGCILLIDMHHIISDGISHEILEKEFRLLYSGATLETLTLQYKDFSEWQNSLKIQEKIQSQESYWLDKFKEEIPVLNLPTDYVRPITKSHEGYMISFALDEEETKNLRLFSNNHDLTLYMSLFSVFTILLSKLSGQDDIIIGTPVAGRNHTDLNNIVGMFVNTLAIRNKINGDDLLSDFIKILRENILNAYDNQDYQFEDLVDKVSVERDTSRNPLFDVTFNLLNHTEYEGDLTKLDDENPVHAPSTSKFDLTLTASDYGKQIMLSFGYSANLFSSDTIDRYIKYFKHLVKQLPEKEEEKISTIEIITELEKQQLLYQFNATEADYPKDKCIHQLFEEQVERTPDNIALVYGVETITYSELNKKSNRIAGYLNTKGKSTNTVIGLYFEPSFEMLISILGVLKSGALYLPINPEFPRDRVDYMLNDSGSDMLLKHSQTSISGLSGIEITEIADVINKTHKVELENKRHQPDSAYLIYTSGTTGNPKGVLLSHENLMNYFAWFNTVSNINRNDRTALVTSYAFDLGYTGLYSSLLIGGELHLVSKELYLSPKTFLDYIIKNRISYLKLTSSLYNLLIDDDKFANAVNNLRLLVLGGEEINVEAVKISISLNNKLQIINHYGPTEGTIGCISFKIHENNIIDYKSNPVIGRPVNNTRVYVLNQYDRIQPFGAVGELCISGDGLAKGYINAPELTAEKFMAHPFREGEKLYRTGDLARRLPDGNIEFLGRVDHQVKIRGFRIELGEIENTLLKHEYIKENVVVAREENGDKYLCAYVVFEQGQEQNINILRDYLTGLLPEYMVPTYFVELEALPLNANGKINLKVLPSPEVKAGDDYVAPSNEIEEKLVEIWSEVLNIPQEKISVTANFFAVGGDSLKVTLTLSKIHKRFKVKVRYADIFKNYVLLDQAKLISKLKKSEFLDIKHTEKREYYPLTRTQKGMFFHQKLYPSSINYTIPVFIPLPFNFKINELGENFEVLLNRHEALRTSIFEMKDAVYQKVHSKIKLQIPVYKRSRFDFHNVLNDIFRPFKLDEPPLIRLCVLIVENEQPILIINVHHIIFDGYSQNILSSELMKVTDGEKIPDLKYQFKDVAVWQSEDQFFLENHEKNKKYWLTKFRDGVPELNLPIDYERTMEENLEAEEFKIILQKDIANKIKQLAGKQDTTVFTVVLSLFYVWLYKITGDDDIIIGTPVSGRYHENLSKICGMFVNTIALRNNPKGDKCYLDFLKDIRKNVLDDLENQWFSFDELVSEICSERKIGRNPIFDVFYTFNGENGAYHEKQNFKSSLLDQKELIDVKFDLNLSGTIQGDEIILSVLFRKHLYEKGTMEYCIQILNNVIDVVMSNHDIKLNDISKNMNEYNYKTVEELDEDF